MTETAGHQRVLIYNNSFKATGVVAVRLVLVKHALAAAAGRCGPRLRVPRLALRRRAGAMRARRRRLTLLVPLLLTGGGRRWVRRTFLAAVVVVIFVGLVAS